MAMLAEPRRKKRSLNLRGKNNWSDDPDKFGSKLMQKMGWTPGKGLGLNEDGKVDNVKVRFKDDNGGVGFADKNDQWTSHETNFEELLRNLHGGNVDKSKLHSESSLEEKSKKLSSRLHYKKFTRGKDITRYSNKDLANIFGKKTLNYVEEKQVQADDPAKEDQNEDTKLILGGCMKDYFQSKLGKRLGNEVSQIVNNVCENGPNLSGDDQSCVTFKGFCSSQSETTPVTNGMDDHAYSAYNSVDRGTNNFKGFNQATEKVIESSKYISFSKASEPDADSNNQQNSAKVTELVGDNDNQIVSKKKKKKKSSAEPLQLKEEVSLTLTTEQLAFASNHSKIVETICRKSKKIKKMKFEQADENNTESVSVIEIGEDEIIVTKKSKKNKRMKVCEDSKDGEAITPHLQELLDNSGQVNIRKMKEKTLMKNTKKYQLEEKTTDAPISEATTEEFKQKKRKVETPTESEPENVKLKRRRRREYKEENGEVVEKEQSKIKKFVL